MKRFSISLPQRIIDILNGGRFTKILFTEKPYVIVMLTLFVLCSNLNAQIPNFLWAKSMGGTSDEGGNSIAVDVNGDVYTTGYFSGTVDFDPSSGVYNMTANDDEDVFVSKLDASGNFLWAKQLGGRRITFSFGANSIVVDKNENVYIVGVFAGTTDFDPGSDTYYLTSADGSNDVFVSKLDASGNFVWAKQITGLYADEGFSITIGSNENIYMTGAFMGPSDFNPGPDIYNMTSEGPYDIFIVALDTSGNFVWAEKMGGVNSDLGFSIAVDANDNIYTTGSFQGTVDFDPGIGVYSLSSIGMDDIFISKLDASGNFLWAKQLGGTSSDQGASIAVDAFGDIYTTGFFNGTADFDPGANTYNLTSGGNDDIFISKLDGSGNFLWANRFGSLSQDRGTCVALDAYGTVCVTGFFQSTVDFNSGSETFNLTAVNGADVFVTKLNNSGDFIWAVQFGGDGYDIANSMTIDAMGDAYITGSFEAVADFDPSNGINNLTSAGGSDIFVAKLGSSICPLIPVISASGPTTICQGGLVTLTSNLGSNLWYNNGTYINEVDQILNVAVSGSYTTRLVILGCEPVESNPLVVTVNPIPVTPSISLSTSNSDLISSASEGNQWYLEGVIIPGATNVSYHPLRDGNYTVKTTQTGCESEFSSIYRYQIPVNSSLGTSYILFPNPTEEFINLKGPLNASQLVGIRLFDFIGRRVMSSKIGLASPLSITKLSAGVYIVELTKSNGGVVFRAKIIKL